MPAVQPVLLWQRTGQESQKGIHHIRMDALYELWFVAGGKLSLG